ncbi:MAG: hypothetical protein JO016_11460 [Actinobacteria bacterium]|nr:hypothetical protein [Actinomycetota bacterium]
MPEVTSDPAALERLRVQRSRLADRMRPPWWYLTGSAILWAVVFASPFGSRYLPHRVPNWPVMIGGLVVACLLAWGLARATGIKMGFRNQRHPSAGRPAAIAMVVVGLAAAETERFLIEPGLLVAAAVVAAVAIAAEVAAQRAMFRGIRQDLRDGSGPA